MNNTAILRKCISELESETPRLDYLRGMLETLVAMQSDATTFSMPASNVKTPLNALMTKEEPTKDEGALLDAQARAAIENVKALAAKSVE